MGARKKCFCLCPGPSLPCTKHQAQSGRLLYQSIQVALRLDDVKSGQKRSCSADSPGQAVQVSLIYVSSEMLTAKSLGGEDNNSKEGQGRRIFSLEKYFEVEAK